MIACLYQKFAMGQVSWLCFKHCGSCSWFDSCCSEGLRGGGAPPGISAPEIWPRISCVRLFCLAVPLTPSPPNPMKLSDPRPSATAKRGYSEGGWLFLGFPGKVPRESQGCPWVSKGGPWGGPWGLQVCWGTYVEHLERLKHFIMPKEIFALRVTPPAHPEPDANRLDLKSRFSKRSRN